MSKSGFNRKTFKPTVNCLHNYGSNDFPYIYQYLLLSCMRFFGVRLLLRALIEVKANIRLLTQTQTDTRAGLERSESNLIEHMHAGIKDKQAQCKSNV